MSRKRRIGKKPPPGVTLEERLRALAVELGRIEASLEDDESWRALRILEARSDRDSSDVSAARARLRRALEANPLYRARSKLAEVISLIAERGLEDAPDAFKGAAGGLAADGGAPPAKSGKARGWYRSLTQSLAELSGVAAEAADGAGATGSASPADAPAARAAEEPAEASGPSTYAAYGNVVEEAIVEIVYPGDARHSKSGAR